MCLGLSTKSLGVFLFLWVPAHASYDLYTYPEDKDPHHTDAFQRAPHAPLEPVRASQEYIPPEEEGCVVATFIDWCVLSGFLSRVGCITFDREDKHMR